MQKRGFTLIELLVVIAIIGILAAIGITAFGGAQGKARDAKRKGDVGSLHTSVMLYYDNNNYLFPYSDAALASSALSTAAASASGFAIPKSPSITTAATNYWYVSSTGSTLMALFTRLESKAVWFVTNSRGFSDEVVPTSPRADYTTVVSPSTSNTICTLSNPAQIYQPCKNLPTFIET